MGCMKKILIPLFLFGVNAFSQNAGNQYFNFLNLPANAPTVAQGGLNVSRAKGGVAFMFNNPALADSSFVNQLSITATDRKSTRLNSSHRNTSRMPSSA